VWSCGSLLKSGTPALKATKNNSYLESKTLDANVGIQIRDDKKGGPERPPCRDAL